MSYSASFTSNFFKLTAYHTRSARVSPLLKPLSLINYQLLIYCCFVSHESQGVAASGICLVRRVRRSLSWWLSIYQSSFFSSRSSTLLKAVFKCKASCLMGCFFIQQAPSNRCFKSHPCLRDAISQNSYFLNHQCASHQH